MIFYRVDWYEHASDRDEGFCNTWFDTKYDATCWAKKEALRCAEEQGEGTAYTVHRVTVSPPINRAVIAALLDGGGYRDEFIIGFEYERRCTRCDHTTNHEDSEDGDACGICFNDGGMEEKDVCRKPRFVIRPVVKETKP